MAPSQCFSEVTQGNAPYHLLNVCISEAVFLEILSSTCRVYFRLRLCFALCHRLVMVSLPVAPTDGKTTTSTWHYLALHRSLSSVMSTIFLSMHFCINSSTSCRVFLPAILAPLLAPSLLDLAGPPPNMFLSLETRKGLLADKCG